MVYILVDNAIRRTRPGGKFDLSVRKTQGRIELLISDLGTVIPEDERTRLSDPFHCSLGNEEMGSGLGLSIGQTNVPSIGDQIHLEHLNAVKETYLRVVASF